MMTAIFTFFVFSFLLRSQLKSRGYVVWMIISLIALLELNQPTLWAALGMLLVQEILVRVKLPPFRFLPLMYAAILISLHQIFHWKVSGFSYLVLASSIDLWQRLNGQTQAFKFRSLNLISFPKALVGPITSAKDHLPEPRDIEVISRLAISGLLKGFVLVNMWRAHVPAPQWEALSGPFDYLWFGLWNYVHLYLEFSGLCDLVAALFWLYGFNCPLNFECPYLSISVTEFWKRWHVTLGLWIKNFVFIPLGGSRVPQWRLYVNLILAMLISGAWHGLTPNFLAWGALQGIFLAAERFFNLEAHLKTAGQAARAASWAFTQLLVTLSWILFFAKF